VWVGHELPDDWRDALASFLEHSVDPPRRLLPIWTALIGLMLAVLGGILASAGS
jgi:hypothetical protein